MRKLLPKLAALPQFLLALAFLALVFLSPSPASAQNTNGLYSGTAQTLTYLQSQYVLAPLPSATITVCNYPATQPSPLLPCTNLALLYADPTTSTPAPAAFAADAQGNFSFWALPGYYAYTVTNILTNVTTGPYSVVISSGSSGGGGGATFPFPGLVFATNSIAGTVATSAQIAAALNLTPSTQLSTALLPLATTTTPGVVQPDNVSITINPTTGVISSTPPTVSIPSTTLVLKGANQPNMAATAQPGVDYVIPSGSVASLSAASTLPNGTVATTQSPGDNTTKLATDAFVLANTSSGGATTPATSLVLRGNGSVNGVVAAAPGTDYVIPSGTVANLFGTPALPNGTTATTQSSGDNSTKLATDAFVLANAGSSTIPATSSLLKGSGTANVSVAATAGTDYLLPSALPATTSILKGSGSAGSVSTAVPCTDYLTLTGCAPTFTAVTVAGTGPGVIKPAPFSVAGTPLPTCNSTSVDSQAMVSDATSPSPFGVYVGSGTITAPVVCSFNGTSYAWLTVGGANGILPTAPGYGYVPVSTGAGSTYSPQTTLLGFGANGVQYIQQPLGNGFFPTAAFNYLNQIFYVDGFSSYGGVGRAVSAFNSSADVPVCSVVSNSGSFYIAVYGTNHTTTPGTSANIWYPVPNNLPATNADCAFYMADSYTRNGNHGSLVQFGNGTYTANQGWVEQTTGSSFGDEFAVSLSGAGQGVTYLVYAGTSGIPFLSRPTGAANFASIHVYDMTIDGGGLASSVMDLDTLNQSYFFNLSIGHVAPGSDHIAQFAHTGGFGFQVFAKNINVGVFPDQNFPSCAQITATGTTTISFTVTNGGTCYTAPTSSLVAHVQLRGTRAGTAAAPCTAMPTGGGVPTFTGNALTSITPMTGGTGCVGPYYVQVYESTPVNYGIVFNNSDSSAEDITSYVGDTAAFSVNSGNFVGTHLHPSVVPNGIIWNGSGALVGTEIDDVFDKAFVLNQPFSTTGASITGTNGFVGCGGTSRINVGSTMYYLAATTVNVNIGDSSSLFDSGGNNSTCNAGWSELLTQSGPILAPSDFATKAPTGFSITGNDKSLTQTATIGDYIPQLTVGTCTGCSSLTGAVLLAPSGGAAQSILQTPANPFLIIPTTAATSSANINSPGSGVGASIWNGTNAVQDLCTWSDQANSGTNPLMALIFACGGSTGGHQLLFGPTITNSIWTNQVNFGSTATVGTTLAIGGDQPVSAGPRAFLQTNTGSLTTIIANGQYSPTKIVKSGTIENIEGTASSLTCTTNPTITLEDCGTSAGTCSSPTALGSATISAANTISDGTITSATLTAGHYVVWETTAGVCTALNLSASAEFRLN